MNADPNEGAVAGISIGVHKGVLIDGKENCEIEEVSVGREAASDTGANRSSNIDVKGARLSCTDAGREGTSAGCRLSITEAGLVCS